MMFEFPKTFDADFYRLTYPEVSTLDDNEAHTHFLTQGKKKGLSGSSVAARESFLAFLLGCRFQAILEIGLGVNPSLTGESVLYFDVRHGEEFYEYARQKGVDDFSHLPEITYYSPDGSLKDITQKFDLVFSSHCIEHSFDIVKHLNEANDLLWPGGAYCLVVPDKRFTFDYFKNMTTVADVLYRHSLNIPYHPLKPYLEVMYETHNDWLRHWRGDRGSYVVTKETVERQTAAFFDQSGRDPGLHAWIFTEDSFHDLISALYHLDIITLRPHRVYNVVADANAFCVVLEKE